ncbi:MAG TPA: mechanosensitive ion channel [Candidatus Bathyarchaeota archaeon]|nr:mechanosensitive ion channel [Candidatus Bathyarchaeota archaeon]
MSLGIGFSGFLTLLSLLGISFVFRDYLQNLLAYMVLKTRREIHRGVRIKILEPTPIKGEIRKIGPLRTTLHEVGDGQRLPSMKTGRYIKIPNHMLIFKPLLIYRGVIIDEVLAHVKGDNLKLLGKLMDEAIRESGCKVVGVGIYQKESGYVIHGMYEISPRVASDKRSEILLRFTEKARSHGLLQ